MTAQKYFDPDGKEVPFRDARRYSRTPELYVLAEYASSQPGVQFKLCIEPMVTIAYPDRFYSIQKVTTSADMHNGRVRMNTNKEVLGYYPTVESAVLNFKDDNGELIVDVGISNPAITIDAAKLARCELNDRERLENSPVEQVLNTNDAQNFMPGLDELEEIEREVSYQSIF